MPDNARTRRAKPTRQQRQVARLLVRGASITRAMTASGYSAAQARKGRAAVLSRAGMRAALREQLEQMAALADAFPPELQEKVIVSRLLQNIVEGRDRAAQSCKQLGQHRELNLWQSESQAGVVVLNVAGDAIKKLALNIPATLPDPDSLDSSPPSGKSYGSG